MQELFISKSILTNSELSSSEKILASYIKVNTTPIFLETNIEISKKTSFSVRKIQRLLSSLRKKGIVSQSQRAVMNSKKIIGTQRILLTNIG